MVGPMLDGFREANRETKRNTSILLGLPSILTHTHLKGGPKESNHIKNRGPMPMLSLFGDPRKMDFGSPFSFPVKPTERKGYQLKKARSRPFGG